MKINFSFIASIALFLFLLFDILTSLGEKSPGYVVDKSMVVTFMVFFFAVFFAGYFTRADQEKLNK